MDDRRRSRWNRDRNLGGFQSRGDQLLAWIIGRGETGATVKEAAQGLGVTGERIRWYLWKLEREGHLVSAWEPTGKRGGCPKRWIAV